MLAVLYDVHGNLPALERVVADAEAAGADGYVLGGDYGAWSPWASETVDVLRSLPNATWIRGNGERWLREPPLDRPEIAEALAEMPTGLGTNEGWLYSLQAQVELDGVLYVHGSPLGSSGNGSFHGALRAPGMRPGFTSTSFGSPRQRFGTRASTTTRSSRRRASSDASIVSSLRGRGVNSRGSIGCSPRVSGPCQPSISITAQASWPKCRSSHHSRSGPPMFP